MSPRFNADKDPSGAEAPWLDLDELLPGDKLILDTESGSCYSFEVTEVLQNAANPIAGKLAKLSTGEVDDPSKPHAFDQDKFVKNEDGTVNMFVGWRIELGERRVFFTSPYPQDQQPDFITSRIWQLRLVKDGVVARHYAVDPQKTNYDQKPQASQAKRSLLGRLSLKRKA